MRNTVRVTARDHGFTLIGAIVSIAIGGIVVMAVLGAVVYSNQSQRNVKLAANFIDLLGEIKIAMESGQNSNCTRNVARAISGFKASSGASPDFRNVAALKPMPISLSYFKADGSVDRDIATVAGETHGLRLNKIDLVPRANIAAGKVLLEIAVDAEKTGDVLGPRMVHHQIPILANIDRSGNFVSCGTGGSTVEEKVCELLSEGDYIYDPATGKCIPRYETKCFPGASATVASCPMGEAADCNSNAVDPGFGSVTRSFTDGTSLVARPKHYKCGVIDEKTVSCIYATDVTIGAATRCSACCKVERVLPGSIAAGP